MLNARFWNISLRSAHLVVAGVLFGGHVFDVPPDHLLVWLYATIATGVVLASLEAYPDLSWFHEARGLCVVAKIALLCCIPWLWEQRVGILVVVFVIGSVGSHMPRRFRHFSPWLGRVVDTSACVRNAAKSAPD